MLDKMVFYFFASIAVLSALLMVTRRNAIHSAVFLITTLLSTAGIFLQLRAEFLFIAQIILYVGGIMVLFIFVIMLVRLDVPLPQIRSPLRQWTAIFVAFVVFGEGVYIVWQSRLIPGHGLLVLNPYPGDKLPPNTEDLAKSLFSFYLLPFEIASVLLLVAMIGAVVMGKKRANSQ